MKLVNGSVNLFCSLIALVLILVTINKKSKFWNQRRHFLYVIIISFVMLISDALAQIVFSQIDSVYTALEIVSIISFYAMEVAYTWFVVSIYSDGKYGKVNFILGFVNSLICVLATIPWIITSITPVFFDIAKNEYITPGGYIYGQLIGFIIVIVNAVIVFINRSKRPALSNIVISITLFIPLLSVVINSLVPGIFSRYALVVLALLLNHARIISELDKELVEKSAVLEKYKYLTSIERIKPHFIFNVLSSIYALVDSDSESAKEAISLFSDYMRRIIKSLNTEAPVPFSWEIELIKNYLEIESMRFGDIFEVEYDIKCEDFFLPPFSIQPLVENSIKHGINGLDRKGLIKISTEETPDEYIVRVEDNGKGFEKVKMAPDKIGLSNIDSVLKLSDLGKLEIDSTLGVGTSASVFIHKKHA